MTLHRALESQEERLMGCVHCGFCLPACPTYVRLGDEADSPRGRLYLMRAVVEGRLDPAAEAFQTHIDRCLGCRACETVCPSGVEYGSLLELARSEASVARPPARITRLILRVFRSKGGLRLVMLVSRILRATRLPAFAAGVLPRGNRIALAAGMLAASHPVPLDRLGATGSATTSEDEGPGTSPSVDEVADDPAEEVARPTGNSVALLEGCVQAGLFAHVNLATERVLTANGHPVQRASGQGCCGALHAHAGALDEARAMARANVDAFESSGVGCVVVNAAGCGAAMKEYGEWLAHDPGYADRARALSERVRDVSEVLASGPLRPGAPIEGAVSYDAPCHLLHAQGVDRAPIDMLRAVPNLTVRPVEGASECCGGAGIYGLTHPELGGRIGRDKVEAVEACGSPVVATGNPGCIMQIGSGLRVGGSPIRAVHPVELLDESYRRAGLYGGT
jgi:glycolate oxidase iron-sulfur subunit